MSAEKKEPDMKPDKNNQIKLIGTFLDANFRMLAPPIIGAVVGYLADKKINSGHLWILVGLFVGVLISVVSIIQLYKKVTK